MSISPQVWAALIAATLSAFGYWMNYRADKRRQAERQEERRRADAQEAQSQEVSLSVEARQWLTQAQSEAREAKTEASAARKEATEARADAEAAGRAMRDATDRFESVMRWVERVVRTAHEHPDDLVRIVNGGPPELTASRLPKP